VEKELRISVRELVAFSYFQEDILPAAGMMEAMHAGARAHRARQAESSAEIEKNIRHVFEVEGFSVLVYGRMDAFQDGEVPFVEEIKLAYEIPSEPFAEHRAQALIYAAMIASNKQCASVCFSICYVNEAGEVLRCFEEELSYAELMLEMHRLFMPWIRFAMREMVYCTHRDESLQTLSFPFENYRQGQRELAVQVYTAITRKKRLFASLPTGTGKSAAVLYPALKALGEGKTEKILYLTARNTARQSPLNALERMLQKGMHVRCCVLSAKDSLCPAPSRCHPDDCPRAKGHYIRQQEACDALLTSGKLMWNDTVIRYYADQFQICPFEFALALTELADVVMMDLNHVFDPFAQVIRLAQRHKQHTLLVDEAHHTVERVRESLSGELDSRELARIRTACGKSYGRKNDVYRVLSRMISVMREMNSDDEKLQTIPEGVTDSVRSLLDVAIHHAGEESMQDLIRICLSFQYAVQHLDEDYAILLEKHGKDRVLTLYCLLPGREINRITKGMRGVVFFSATLSPLPAMKRLLGGQEEDACFSLPSPFPKENLAVVRRRVNTRYENRQQSAEDIARAIHEAFELMRGNMIAFFPSYAYLQLVLSHLDQDKLPLLWIQEREMGEESRKDFLNHFENTQAPCLAMCVLGGLFSEGIDLPGNQLKGVIITGVGLPVPSTKLQAIRDCYHEHFGDGFAYAMRIPGMQKVLQAAGRVIRSETDKGLVVLLDDRYFQRDYEGLLPAEWTVWNDDLVQTVKLLEKNT